MATTLNRADTGKFLSMRTLNNETPTNGDFWRAFFSDNTISNALFNGWVDWYDNNEDLADDEALIGTHPNGNTYPIYSLPDRPRPVKRS